MSATTLISESDYLQMTFEGYEDDFVDGVVLPRATPTNSHSMALGSLQGLFFLCAMKHDVFPRPGLRLRLAPGRFRVADLVVYTGEAPKGDIPLQVPHVAVEVVSDDRFQQLMAKLADYQAFGVPHIWLADPALRSLSIYRDGSLTSVPELALPEFDISVKIAEVFA